jgi:hypothetical protein
LGESRRAHEHIKLEEILFSCGNKESKVNFGGTFSCPTKRKRELIEIAIVKLYGEYQGKHGGIGDRNAVTVDQSALYQVTEALGIRPHSADDRDLNIRIARLR